MSKNKQVKEESSEEEFESFVDEEPIGPVSINKYDPYQLRECTNETIQMILEEMGFVEDTKIIDMKIIIDIILAASTIWAYLYKKDEENVQFRDKRTVLFISVVIYGVFMALYYYIDYFVAGNIFFTCKDHEVSLRYNLKHFFSSNAKRLRP